VTGTSVVYYIPREGNESEMQRGKEKEQRRKHGKRQTRSGKTTRGKERPREALEYWGVLVSEESAQLDRTKEEGAGGPQWQVECDGDGSLPAVDRGGYCTGPACPRSGGIQQLLVMHLGAVGCTNMLPAIA
jgi:hypothetical protein